MATRARVQFELAHPNTAGIDVGSASHWVAVPADRDDEPVREFKSFTVDLNALADWLVACGIETVAMESTGVYWIPLFELLESRGFTVFLVNARHVKNVSGRKSDVLDCQWLQQLMSFGLLSGAYRPKEDICALRAVARQRDMLLSYQGQHIQHMQKALTQMNLQLTNVISDVAGKTGQAIIRAIVEGERNPVKLAGFRDRRIHASAEDIAKSLHGTWREEHLFSLKQAVALYDAYQARLEECDRQLEQSSSAWNGTVVSPANRTAAAPKIATRPALMYAVHCLDSAALISLRSTVSMSAQRLRSSPKLVPISAASKSSSTFVPGWVFAPVPRSPAAKCLVENPNEPSIAPRGP
jgi:transposase